ncbi:hypothetical protein Shyhy01_17470 [Streptomyces hygroscopicus subsp. hygroscopicus]|nr:hypothetical protein [Streptomyces hygroscopicus]GLX48797.1 hypothetical protein Shyhy01_17470 [Streptomyces hygroscopicus subsp. hygroscopicus]
MEVSPYVAFFFLFFGMVAFNDLMVGSPWTKDLRAIAEAGGLSGAI